MVHSKRSLRSGYGHVPGMPDDGNWSDVQAQLVPTPSVSFLYAARHEEEGTVLCDSPPNAPVQHILEVATALIMR